MSHDLDESIGTPAMAYVGEKPWHGLGEALPPDQDIETWVQAARLDWEIEMLPVNYQMGGRNHVMRDRFVLARSDRHPGCAIGGVWRLPGGAAQRGVGVLPRPGRGTPLQARNGGRA